MRISPPHAGHRRRSGRKTRSRSGVLDWRLAIAPLQLDCKPNRPSLPDSKLCRRSFFLRRQSEMYGLAFQVGEIGLGVSAEATLERAGLAPLVEASADRLPARAIDAPQIACARRRQPGRRARNQAHRAAHHGPGRGGLATAGPPLVIAARAEELLET